MIWDGFWHEGKYIWKLSMCFFNFIMSTSLDLNSIAIVQHLRQDGVNHEDCRVNQQKFMILSNFFTLWAKISPLAPTSLIFRHANNFWRHLRCSIRPSGNNLCVACTIYNPKPHQDSMVECIPQDIHENQSKSTEIVVLSRFFTFWAKILPLTYTSWIFLWC